MPFLDSFLGKKRTPKPSMTVLIATSLIRSNPHLQLRTLARQYCFLKKRNELITKNVDVTVFNEAISKSYLGRGLAYIETGNSAKACNDFNIAINYGLKNGQKLIDEYCK